MSVQVVRNCKCIPDVPGGRSPGGPVTRVAPSRLGTALSFDCCCREQQAAVDPLPATTTRFSCAGNGSSRPSSAIHKAYARTAEAAILKNGLYGSRLGL